MSNIYLQNWEIGCHTSFNGKITSTVSEAIHLGMYTTQFFMGNPKSYNRQHISSDDIENTKVLIDMYPLNVFTHFPYIANLNGSVKSLAWNGDIQTDKKLRILMKQLEYELGVVSNFKTSSNTCGVVIHPGCYPDRNIGHNTIAKTLNKINFEANSLLLLENCAGEGRKLCKTFKEIRRVFEGCNESIMCNLGVCVDTAHIWGSGEYNLSKNEEIDRMFSEFDHHLGLNNFKLLHLNDSQVEFGSKKDRHENIGYGHIWGESTESLLYLMEKCSHFGIPIVLETSSSDLITMSLL